MICEGQTEEAFVNNLLVEPFALKGIYLRPALIGKPGHKGGNFKFERLLPDIRNRLTADKNCYCTTFFDFYGLPTSFPGKTALDPGSQMSTKAGALQNALVEKLTASLGEDVVRRFIPFVQMYEFEALLFSDPQKMAVGMDKPELVGSFQSIADAFESPEHINDSPQTAPSKRIEDLIYDYEKPLMGTLAALEIGLDAMREKCALFNAWLQQIETLAVE
ncbi:DUF4276 family protein [Oceanisphaera ostreae]|uniref:DUF4276 family protein n=1 Tax=Oceanisphaera ostreae TaxID=914151 RepID=A0ABW3KKS7_9GAMM